jgi:predicted RNA polymerase sigma factor
MSERSAEQIRELLDSLYRLDSGRILATLIRLLGDCDLAEEAMHEAFAAALSLWPRSGVPDNPRPWLISTARFKAIDTLHRRARFDASQVELVRYLLSLMLFQESRQAARTTPAGELILLEGQDRSLWNREQIAEGVALVERALKSHRFGSYTLQAAIAAVHTEAESAAVTDWRQIVALYHQLTRIQPSPVVELNRAVAIAMRDGPGAGLAFIDAVLAHGKLANYYLAHTARADMCRRLGRIAEARSSYEKALALTQQEPEEIPARAASAVELKKRSSCRFSVSRTTI